MGGEGVEDLVRSGDRGPELITAGGEGLKGGAGVPDESLERGLLALGDSEHVGGVVEEGTEVAEGVV